MTDEELAVLATDAGLAPGGWTDKDTEEAVWEPSYQDGCPQLQEEMNAFYDDPITVAYGAAECAPLVEQAHIRKHGCRGYEQRW